MKTFKVFTIFIFFLTFEATAGEIAGSPSITDGDTIKIINKPNIFKFPEPIRKHHMKLK